MCGQTGHSGLDVISGSREKRKNFSLDLFGWVGWLVCLLKKNTQQNHSGISMYFSLKSIGDERTEREISPISLSN